MAGKLDKYKSKRDFTVTPEPEGGLKPEPGQARFVIREHDATNLHWDLRFEREGVLVSFALPRGIPEDPKRNHLAVHTEDHPIEYIDFHGEIPKGNYGAGRMTIWDQGTYQTKKFLRDEIMVILHGGRVEGQYVLFQTEGKNWMIHRMDPPPVALDPMPEDIVPMFAKLSEMPRDDSSYAFEIKWDGVRAISYIENGHMVVQSRNLNDVTKQYPELRAMARSLGMIRVVLDGEIVAFGEDGRPSFGHLQRRMHLTGDAQIKRRAVDTPVTYLVFDLLYLNGHSTTGLAYRERRKLLEQLELEGPNWRVPASHEGEGEAILAASVEQQLEGVVAKRLDSTYEPGARTTAWRKIKNFHRQEFVVGGWLPGQGARSKSLGSLALGYYAGGDLVYAGNVGSGFTDAMLRELSKQLGDLRTEETPFSGRQPPKEAIFVTPRLVVDVDYGEWTRDKTLRHPIFKGIRTDKSAQDVVLEGEASAGDTD